MGYNADKLSVLPQSRQCFQGRFQGVFIKGAESLIEKKGVNPDIPAGHLRKAKRQGQAHDKAFPAGEIFGGTNLARLVVVDHIQFQGVGGVADEKIAIRHLPELPVGMGGHHLKGQPLGKIPEFFAVCGTDELMQVIPS